MTTQIHSIHTASDVEVKMLNYWLRKAMHIRNAEVREKLMPTLVRKWETDAEKFAGDMDGFLNGLAALV